MSAWGNQILTRKGQELMAYVEANRGQLKLTRMELGSGDIASTDAQTMKAMEALKHKEMDLGLTSCEVSPIDKAVCTVIANATSAHNTHSFTVRELGLYAVDPRTGTEILYLVVADSSPDVMPAQDPKIAPVTVTYQLDITIGDAQVSATINPAGLVTVEMLAKAEGWSMWEIDLEGGVMPVTNPLYHPYWETDDNGDIMPRNAS